MLIENIYNQISIIEREIAVLPEEALQIRRSRIRIQVLDLKEKIECRGLS